jgi:hypothetical protein
MAEREDKSSQLSGPGIPRMNEIGLRMNENEASVLASSTGDIHSNLAFIPQVVS